MPSKHLKILVKIRFASKIVRFQKKIECALAINLCYIHQSLQFHVLYLKQANLGNQKSSDRNTKSYCETMHSQLDTKILALVSAIKILVKLQAKSDCCEMHNPPLMYGKFD